MEFSFGGDPLFSAAMQHLMDLPDELERQLNPPTCATTPMDVKELPSGALVLAVDMPGGQPCRFKAQVEEVNVLTISDERKRPADDDGGGVKYLRMERRMGKFMGKFPLPESTNLDSFRAEYKDVVLTVTVDKLPPPEPKKLCVVEVKFGGAGQHGATKGGAGASGTQGK